MLKMFSFLKLTLRYNLNKTIVIYARVTLSRSWHKMDTRWRKISNSALIVNTSGYIGPFVRAFRASVWPPVDFQAPAVTSWAMAKSLACQRIARRHCEGSLSVCIRVSMLPFVRPSWEHLVKSCHLRNDFVWSSVPSGINRLTKTIRRKQEASRMSSEGNTTTWSPRNAIV